MCITIEYASLRITETSKLKNEGVFLVMDNGERIRIDRIITLFGKPGAANDDYGASANASMSCLGGYEKNEL
ncbi:hypothetical protein ACS5PU_17240 [Pedobacter sp. GSP4]|uniref:hypothetical protein n=1 Tax=Pedobacter sp. GSP4 TaxID=3453716 RepID=UPI003EE93E9A